MSFFTRALRAIRYYKRNTLLLFIIFSILFALVLSGLCIREASIETARRTGIEVGGSVLVDAKEQGAGGLSLESAQKMAAHPAVREALFSSTIAASSWKGFSGVPSFFEDVLPGDHDITLMGANGAHPILQNDCTMVSGARPKAGDKGFVVIHEAIASQNFVEVGDVISVAPEKGGKDAVELTVTGVYTRGEYYHYGSPEGYVENTLFTDLETVAAIRGNTGLQGVQLIVYDPADIPGFLSDIEAMALPDRDSFGIVPLDGEYRKISLSMDSIVAVASLVFWVAMALGAILLIALVMLSLSSREFEIGVLLSMGEVRGKVILQLALETLVPVLLGATAGVLLSGQTAAFAAKLLGAAEKGIEVGIEGRAIGLVYLCGMGLMLLASCVTAFKVLRFQPKKLLMAVE